MKERLHKAINGRSVDYTPVVAFTQTGTKDLMTESGASWPDASYDAEKMAALAISGFERAGFEAVRVPFCLTVLLESLGCCVGRGETLRQPSITSHPYNSRKPQEPSPVPDDLIVGCRIPVVLDAIKIIREKVGDDVPIIAGCEGPVTVASDLLEVTTFMKWFIKYPDAVRDYIALGNTAVKTYASSLFEAGADIVALLDPVASPDLLSPKFFESFIVPEYRDLSRALSGDTVLHICGDVTPILGYFPQTGFTAVSIEEKTSMAEAKEKCSSAIRVVGNVSTSSTLFSGTPQEVYNESIRALEDKTDVLAPGCGLAPLTPIENCRAMVRARNDYFK